MKKTSFVLVVAGLLFAAPVADAKVLELYGQIQAGGMYGKGVAGAQKSADFFNQAAGGSYGLLVGAEILWIDGWVEHNQFIGSGGLTGTWTQFMVGFDVDFELDSPPPPKDPNDAPNKSKVFGEIGLALGFGVGTGQQVDPPLDNAQISDKGFLGQLTFAVDYRFSKLVSAGVTIPITYGYMFKNGVDSNNSANQYQSVHAGAFFHLRLHLELK